MSASTFQIESVLAFCAAGLLRASVCGSIALLLAWAVTRVPRLTTPAARCWVWRFALLQLFVAFAWSQPVVKVPVLPPSPAPAAVTVEAPAEERMLFERWTTAAPTPAPERRIVWDAGTWSVIAWGLAALLGVTFLGIDWRRSLRTERKLTAVEDGELLARCGALSRVLGLPYVPYVGTSPEIETPTLLGMTRLTVALPESLLQTASAPDLELVLAHELAHIRRKDLHWTWLPVLTRTLFFFHPLVWLAQREYHLAQEGACDALAMESTGASGARYGELLLRVSTGLGEPNGRLAAARMGESFSQLARRLEVIKHVAPVTHHQRALSSLLVSGMAVVALTPWQLDAWAASADVAANAGPYQIRVAGIRRGGSSTFSSSSSFGGGAAFGTGGLRRFETPQAQNEFRPSVTIDLEVTAADAKALDRLAGIASGAQGTDNLGKAAVSGPMPSMSFPRQSRVGVRTERIELAVDPAATLLKTVDAALLVQTAEERVISFAANEVRRGTVKRVGNVTARIESAEVTDQGWQIGVTFETPQAERPAPGAGPFARMQQTMLTGRSIKAILHDNDGQEHSPRMYAGGGGSGGASFGGRVGFSSTSSGNRSFTFGGGPQNPGPARSSHTYTFGPLVVTQPERLEFRVMERTGEPKRIPFRVGNINIPVAR